MTAHKLSHHGVLFRAEFVTGPVVDVITRVDVIDVVIVVVVTSVENGNVIGVIYGGEIVVEKSSVYVTVSGEISRVTVVVVVVVDVVVVVVVVVVITGFVDW